MNITTSNPAQTNVSDGLNKNLLLQILNEFIPDLICIHNAEGKFEFVSASSKELLGYQPEDLIGKSFFDLVYSEELNCVREELEAHLNSKKSEDFNFDCRLVKSSGEPVWMEISVKKILQNGKNFEHYLTVSREQNEQKTTDFDYKDIEEKLARLYFDQQKARAEAEVAQRQTDIANRAKDEFLQLISHEFRTPLTTIKTLSRLLQQGGETFEERNEYLETIVSECDRQLNMILNLLDVARIDEGEIQIALEKIDINNILRACEKIHRHAANERNQIFEVFTNEKLPYVCAHEKTLRRAICSIMENAIKYTQYCGKVAVSAEKSVRIADKSYQKAKTVGIELSPAYKPADSEKYTVEEVAIKISDTGRGIHPEDIPLLFQKFFRGRRVVPHDLTTDGTPDDAMGRAETPGVGLGLYLANKLILSLGGRIEVKSEVGRGSTFTIFLKVRCDDEILNSSGESYLP